MSSLRRIRKSKEYMVKVWTSEHGVWRHLLGAVLLWLWLEKGQHLNISLIPIAFGDRF